MNYFTIITMVDLGCAFIIGLFLCKIIGCILIKLYYFFTNGKW